MPNNNIDDLEMPAIMGRNGARNDPSKDDPFKRKKGGV